MLSTRLTMTSMIPTRYQSILLLQRSVLVKSIPKVKKTSNKYSLKLKHYKQSINGVSYSFSKVMLDAILVDIDLSLFF